MSWIEAVNQRFDSTLSDDPVSKCATQKMTALCCRGDLCNYTRNLEESIIIQKKGDELVVVWSLRLFDEKFYSQRSWGVFRWWLPFWITLRQRKVGGGGLTSSTNVLNVRQQNIKRKHKNVHSHSFFTYILLKKKTRLKVVQIIRWNWRET